MIKLPSPMGSSNRIYVGFNIGDGSCQISYCIPGGEVETISTLTGSEQYSIPTVLCKREGVNQWFFGKEAVRYYAENGGILVDHLLSKASDGEPIFIDGSSYDPVSLLSLYLKRCMTLVTNISSDKMAGVLFTTENMDHDQVEMLKKAIQPLKLKTDKIYFQSHTESFYHYMIHQQPELWQIGSMLFDYEEDSIKAYKLETNLRTDPIVVYIDEQVYPMPEFTPQEENMEQQMPVVDKAFLQAATEACSNERFASVFLIGEKFSDQWMNESKKYLCSNFRVFIGNNLYSKGACYGLIDRLVETEASKDNIFLGNDKLTANIGMNILRQGEQKYFAILDAGLNWYDASQTFDFYMDGGAVIELLISSITGSGNSVAKITLEEFSGQLTRMRARLYMENVKLLVVEIEDLGLGAFRAATHRTWTEQIPIN